MAVRSDVVSSELHTLVNPSWHETVNTHILSGDQNSEDKVTWLWLCGSLGCDGRRGWCGCSGDDCLHWETFPIYLSLGIFIYCKAELKFLHPWFPIVFNVNCQSLLLWLFRTRDFTLLHVEPIPVNEEELEGAVRLKLPLGHPLSKLKLLKGGNEAGY